jgi:cation:H+ antiporter
MTISTLILFALGFFLLVQGAESLVRGASKLAIAIGLSPLVIGLTIVAYGTSAPELSVSLTSIFNDQANLAIGNAIGSNITNILLILGICAVIAPLAVLRQVIRIDIPVMILTTGVLLPMSLDGQLNRIDGAILSAIALVYTLSTATRSSDSSATSEANPIEPNETADAERLGDDSPKPQSLGAIAICFGQISLGTGMLVLGSDWLVKGAVAIATAFGVDESIIGLSVIAIGTSLPELAASVVATIDGERDIAIGNIIGSNICNVVIVLGLPALVTSHAISVTSDAMWINIPFALAVEVACLSIAFTGYVISRWEGFLFLFYYIAYVTYLFLKVSHSSALSLFDMVMLKAVIPITAIGLLSATLFAFRTRRN